MTAPTPHVRCPGTIEFGNSCAVLTLSAHRDPTHGLAGRNDVLLLVPGSPLCLTHGPFKWVEPEKEKC